jgi:hypothetical protein
MVRHDYLGRKRFTGADALAIAALFAIPQCGTSSATSEQATANGSASSSGDRTPRPDNAEACERCGGLWGVHGIAQTESCICRTKDGGQACTSADDCEGACIIDEHASFEVVEPGDTPLGVFVGRCADYDTTFGCYRVAPPRTGEETALPEDQAAQDICVD